MRRPLVEVVEVSSSRPVDATVEAQTFAASQTGTEPSSFVDRSGAQLLQPANNRVPSMLGMTAEEAEALGDADWKDVEP